MANSADWGVRRRRGRGFVACPSPRASREGLSSVEACSWRPGHEHRSPRRNAAPVVAATVTETAGGSGEGPWVHQGGWRGTPKDSRS